MILIAAIFFIACGFHTLIFEGSPNCIYFWLMGGGIIAWLKWKCYI